VIIFELMLVAAQIAFLYLCIWAFLFLFAWLLQNAGLALMGFVCGADDGWDWLRDAAFGVGYEVQQNAFWLGATIGTAVSQAANVCSEAVGGAVSTVDSWLPWNWGREEDRSEGGAVSGDVLTAEGALA